MTTTTVNEGDKVNIKITKGKTYKHVFTYVYPVGHAQAGQPVDITGFGARMQIRGAINDATYVYQALSGVDINIGGITGQVSLSIPADTSAAWTFDSGVYDLELIDLAGDVIGLVGVSRVAVGPEVTR